MVKKNSMKMEDMRTRVAQEYVRACVCVRVCVCVYVCVFTISVGHARALLNVCRVLSVLIISIVFSLLTYDHKPTIPNVSLFHAV